MTSSGCGAWQKASGSHDVDAHDPAPRLCPGAYATLVAQRSGTRAAQIIETQACNLPNSQTRDPLSIVENCRSWTVAGPLLDRCRTVFEVCPTTPKRMTPDPWLRIKQQTRFTQGARVFKRVPGAAGATCGAVADSVLALLGRSCRHLRVSRTKGRLLIPPCCRHRVWGARHCPVREHWRADGGVAP